MTSQPVATGNGWTEKKKKQSQWISANIADLVTCRWVLSGCFLFFCEVCWKVRVLGRAGSEGWCLRWGGIVYSPGADILLKVALLLTAALSPETALLPGSALLLKVALLLRAVLSPETALLPGGPPLP